MSKVKNTHLVFDPDCQKCPRISENLATIRREHPDYHARPVPAFGDNNPRLLIVGLGPGKHGANATGRPFTGDYAGILLYKMLYEFAYANIPEAIKINDGLKLKDCRITNAVKCLPPENKPLPTEIKNCNAYLKTELDSLSDVVVILCLGKIAHDACLRALDRKLSEFRFSHNATHQLDDKRYLVDSYHCSRYNTQTRRLTEDMFRDVFKNIHGLLNG